MPEPESHTLAHLPRIDEKLDRIEDRLGTVESRLGRIEDELLVLNGIALRLEGREVETTSLKAMLDRHERWPGDLGRRVGELEGAPKKCTGPVKRAFPHGSVTLRPTRLG